MTEQTACTGCTPICPSWWECSLTGFDDEECYIPSLEDEYMDTVEDMMLYPQNYSEERMNLYGLELSDVYPGEDTTKAETTKPAPIVSSLLPDEDDIPF